MTLFYKIVENGYIIGIGTNGNNDVTSISETEYNEIEAVIRSAPTPPSGYTYILTDNLKWELVTKQPEPISEDEALVRYSNELTGANDETLEEATETLIKIIKENS